MKRWKVSEYVTQVSLDEVDTLLLYGGLAGRLLEVTGDGRSRAQALLEDPNLAAGEEASELREMFEHHGILVPEEWDEHALLEQRSILAHDPNQGPLNLTICPTINCNYRCTYCYQEHVGTLMSEEVQDRLLSLIDNQEPPVTSLNITWFGGEPLLGRSVIERLAPLLRERVADDAFSAHMISNGWLLTPDVSEWLVEIGVTSVQITLDGPRDVHNKRRPKLGGQATFDRILENLSGADPRLNFSVRVNTDQQNAENVSELFDQLDAAGLRGRVNVYFAPVMPYTEICADTAGDCIVGQDWSRLNANLRLASVKRGYGGPALPSSKSSVCIADNPRGWVIAPTGLIYKCWNDVTQPDNAVLDLASGEQSDRMKLELKKWQDWSPFKLSECTDCKVLPQCHSGCAHLAMQQPGEINHGDCTELKWNLPETLATYYLSHQKREVAEELMDKIYEAGGQDESKNPYIQRLYQIEV